MEIKKRFRRLTNYLIANGVVQTQGDLSVTLGYNETYISRLANGKCPITKDFKERLAELDEDINPDYLEGKGAMLHSQADVEDCEEDEDEIEASNIVPYVSSEIARDANIDIKDLIVNNSDEVKFRNLPDLMGTFDYAQKVITSAMAPLFLPGDFLFVKFLPDNTTPISGAIYLLDTSKFGAMVRQVYLEGDTYKLHPINSDYKEIELKREDIFSIGLVVRSLRADFNMPSGECELRASLQSRDRQIDGMMETTTKLVDESIRQNERMSTLVTELIKRAE